MDDSAYSYCERLISPNYVRLSREAKATSSRRLRTLLEHRKIPEQPFDERLVMQLLDELAAMDTNNYAHRCGAGEREGRIYSGIVARRHFHMAHGVGRSGDIAAVQPKAAGSSIVAKLANELSLHAIRLAGVPNVHSCCVIPMATGMTLALCMQAFRRNRPRAKFVLWTRVDQKSSFKSIIGCGFQPIVIENRLVGDELATDLNAIVEHLDAIDVDEIACVLSVTSVFAPRSPDALEEIAELCQQRGIPHLINNAYGTQSSKCMHLIASAARRGRVDAFVQSLDKNFLVPVGGSIVGTFSADTMQLVTGTYPGRASAIPATDLVITLLQMGTIGYEALLADRRATFNYLKRLLEQFALVKGERVLHTPTNLISLALTLNTISVDRLGQLGSKLFSKGVTGARVLVPNRIRQKSTIIDGYSFSGFGTHYDDFPHAYMTVAAAVGSSLSDIDTFIERLEKAWKV